VVVCLFLACDMSNFLLFIPLFHPCVVVLCQGDTLSVLLWLVSSLLGLYQGFSNSVVNEIVVSSPKRKLHRANSVLYFK
jgi:hypothetical protein